MGTVENSAPVRAALYARVSSDQQVQEGTIARQVEALQEWIGREGLILDPQLQFIDEGYRATTLVRPALERLRDLAALGLIDRLYVYAPDRLARKDAYQVLLLEEFERAGVTVLFRHQPLGEGPDARRLRQVQGIVAEYERTQILERSRRGKLHAARHGSVTAKQAAVQKVQRGLDRLIDAYQIGLLERTQFEPRVRRAQEQLQTLHDQIAALQAEQSGREDLQLIVGQVETFRKMLEGSLEQADWSTRRQVITTLVKQIEIHEENVKIVYRIDRLPFAPAPEGGVLQYCWWRERPRDRPWAEPDLWEGRW